MSLPFLSYKNNQGAGVQTVHRAPDSPDDTAHDGLRAASRDLIAAVSAGDAEKVSAALRAAFDILDSEPHVEGPHMDDEGEGA